MGYPFLILYEILSLERRYMNMYIKTEETKKIVERRFDKFLSEEWNIKSKSLNIYTNKCRQTICCFLDVTQCIVIPYANNVM